MKIEWPRAETPTHWITMGADTSLVASFGVAGSLAAGAVVLGYYLSYWLGIQRRLRRHLAA